ncbi:polysaccharide lyase [Pseudanabaena phage Pam4]|nr:polysaccharide lyase [Pseudanabaena phage Pam4]
MDGFENSVVVPPLTTSVANMAQSFQPGRWAGGVSLRGQQSNNSAGTLQVGIPRPDSSGPTLQVGAACRAPIAFALQVREGGTVHAILRTNTTTGLLEVVNGNGTVLATAAIAPTINNWNHYALAVTCHDTTGVVVAWLNGVQVISATNVDTRNGGTGVLTGGHLVLNTNLNGSNAEADDLYLTDSLDYVGDCRVVRLLPNGAGDATDWTPSTAPNWSAVDDTSSADYVGTATPAAKDLYAITDLDPSLTVVRAVQTDLLVWKSDAGAALDLNEVRKSSGGVEDIATTVPAASITTTPTWVKGTAENTDPAGDPWTAALVNGLQVGVSVP